MQFIVGFAVLVVAAALTSGTANADKAECIAPAKPGGGLGLTCQLVQRGLQGYLKHPLQVSYMPGGIGAVTYSAIVAQRPAEGNTIVSFSGGSLLNLAERKFGKYNENDVRWLAAIGTDYGVVIVSADSPYRSLQDLIVAIKKDPKKVIFGIGGTIGSQDWIKAALLARAAGVDHKACRFVTFEGGGEATTALISGHVQMIAGDASEAANQLREGKIRVLAVLAETRLPGPLQNVPTAREQGINIVWPTIRGFYMGPKVSDVDYRYWVETFKKMLASKEFAKLREQGGLAPLSMTGAELDAYVKQTVPKYAEIAREFGLVK